MFLVASMAAAAIMPLVAPTLPALVRVTLPLGPEAWILPATLISEAPEVAVVFSVTEVTALTAPSFSRLVKAVKVMVPGA